jgi:hypothetical protein
LLRGYNAGERRQHDERGKPASAFAAAGRCTFDGSHVEVPFGENACSPCDTVHLEIAAET